METAEPTLRSVSWLWTNTRSLLVSVVVFAVYFIRCQKTSARQFGRVSTETVWSLAINSLELWSLAINSLQLRRVFFFFFFFRLVSYVCHYKQTPVLSCFETVWCVNLNNTHRTSILQPKQFQSTAGFALCRLPRTLLRVTSANEQQRAKWTKNSTHCCDSYGGSDGSEGVVL